MKRKRIKGIIHPVRCSFCRDALTLYRIQGHPHGGKTACIDCFRDEQKRQDEYNERWGNREQSEAEFQLGV